MSENTYLNGLNANYGGYIGMALSNIVNCTYTDTNS